MRRPGFEVCVDSLEGVEVAKTGGADRVELCSALEVGGLTPSPGLLREAVKIGLPIHAMIRPRAGGFVLSAEDLRVMLSDIEAAAEAGVSGVVLGALTVDGQLDQARLEHLVQAADPLHVTLHRAIDLTPDPVTSVSIARDLGIARILTSGAALRAVDGQTVIRAMVEAAADDVEIMGGSGLTAENVESFWAATGVHAAHASCAGEVSGTVKEQELGFGHQRQTSLTKVQAMRQAIDRMGNVPTD